MSSLLPRISQDFPDDCPILILIYVVGASVTASVTAAFIMQRKTNSQRKNGLLCLFRDICCFLLLVLVYLFVLELLLVLLLATALHLSGVTKAEEAWDKEVMRKEFTAWFSHSAVKPQLEDIDMEFRKLKEFHRCKALEDVDEAAFRGIVENMAKVVESSNDRKEETAIIAAIAVQASYILYYVIFHIL